MQTTEVNSLEAEVDNLLRSVDQYKIANKSLQDQIIMINRERIRLKEQNRMAARKIKDLISQLRKVMS